MNALPKTMIALIAIAMMTMIATPVLAADTAKQIIPKLLKYQPAPAEPGNYVDVYLLISNRREEVKDFKITLKPKYPFMPAEDQESTITLPSIPALDETLLKWRVFVDLDARNEDYNMTWLYTWGGQGGQLQFEDEITVQSTDASLTVDHYTIDPVVVKPGSNASLVLSLSNNGKILTKDIDVHIDLTGTSFSTYGTGSNRRIPRIGPGNTEDLAYNVVIDPKADTGVYAFPVNLNFRDERNNRYNSSSRVSIVVNDQPEIMAVVDSTTITEKNVTGDVTFKVVNSGAADIKFLQMQLLPSVDYDAPVASTTVYLGNLDTDDFETETMKIKTFTETPVFLIRLDYSDPFNKKYNRTFEVPMRIVSPQELGQGGSNAWIYAVIGAVVLAGGLYYFTRRKNGQKK